MSRGQREEGKGSTGTDIMEVLANICDTAAKVYDHEIVNSEFNYMGDEFCLHCPLVPGPPTSLVLDSPSETEITLHWTPPDQPNGILIGYVLQYQQSENHSTLFLSNVQHEV